MHSNDTLAQQYAAYLAFKEASDMADLKTRMAGMNERIAKLEVRCTPPPHTPDLGAT